MMFGILYFMVALIVLIFFYSTLGGQDDDADLLAGLIALLWPIGIPIWFAVYIVGSYWRRRKRGNHESRN